ncbi:MAG: hypothetical protein M1832_001534 [Thelocarpon impressellum]|nr:MAG: hypothetical protein M1832_001534 [Thelocarpon impressellum]
MDHPPSKNRAGPPGRIPMPVFRLPAIAPTALSLDYDREILARADRILEQCWPFDLGALTCAEAKANPNPSTFTSSAERAWLFRRVEQDAERAWSICKLDEIKAQSWSPPPNLDNLLQCDGPTESWLMSVEELEWEWDEWVAGRGDQRCATSILARPEKYSSAVDVPLAARTPAGSVPVLTSPVASRSRSLRPLAPKPQLARPRSIVQEQETPGSTAAALEQLLALNSSEDPLNARDEDGDLIPNTIEALTHAHPPWTGPSILGSSDSVFSDTPHTPHTPPGRSSATITEELQFGERVFRAKNMRELEALSRTPTPSPSKNPRPISPEKRQLQVSPSPKRKAGSRRGVRRVTNDAVMMRRPLLTQEKQGAPLAPTPRRTTDWGGRAVEPRKENHRP